jgi:uncharacterized lipoprotein NlpE involved in copper resistance
MKKIIYIFFIVTAFVSCKNTTEENNTAEQIIDTEQVPDMHTSEIALDWQGVYRGVLPCADCEGIVTTVKLNDDSTYIITRLYLGKDEKAFEETGFFQWTEDGNAIVLKEKIKDSPTLFKVGENHLLHLSQDGQIIEGELAERYILRKE